MHRSWICLALAAACLMLTGTAEAVAQSPAAIYNANRAYQHFWGSRYSYRTLYSATAGSGRVQYTPFSYQSQFVEPSFSRQRITPFGYERYDRIPGYGGTMIAPFGMSNFYFSGFGYGIIAPHGAEPFQYFTP